MPTINATNSGTGLDVRGLVDQLVAAEGGPVSSRLDRKEVNIQEGLTAIGTFKGALLDFQASLAPLRKENAFKSINAISSNEEKFTVSAADNAVLGSYNIEISQLAQSQKLKSQAFDSEFDTIGSGTISIEFGKINNATNSFDVNSTIPTQHIEIDEENGSLRGIQQAINEANAGVRGSIINDGTGYRLILNSEKSGIENSLRISISDDDVNDEDLFGLSLLAYNPVVTAGEEDGIAVGKNLEQAAQAKNALFSIDGISISNSKNEITDSIPGLTLSLKKITEDSFESFKIEKETTRIKQSIETFVSSYNELMTTVSSLTGFDSESGRAGPLSGDSAIRGIIDQIRRRLSTSFNGINENLTSLSIIGIDSSRDGSLSLDDFKLDKALENHANEIAHLFAAAVSTSDAKIRVTSEKIPATDGVFNITIDQIPASASFSGRVLANYPENIFDVPEKIQFSIDDITTGELKLLPRSFESGKAFAAELERVINQDANLKRNDKTVSVTFINNALKIVSNSIGLASGVSIISIGQNLSSLTGLATGKGQSGNDLKATVNGYEITGEGTKLKLEGVLSGVVIDVSGKQTGNRGQLTVTNGVASILDELTTSFLDSKGLLSARIDGYNSKIKNIDKERENLVRKLEVSEQRYLKQFSNLDAMLGKMRSTSNFLAEKLSTLPGARRN
ncbi:MAG: flagellar filament capping protein FliD [Gammaproteobacteria bacterium]|nr:flagellar filament capping protein FliD [Gammaproteobacteria bacterium]